MWQLYMAILFARVDDRQIFVFKSRQAMLDGQNLVTLWGVSSTRTIILCVTYFYLPHKNIFLFAT